MTCEAGGRGEREEGSTITINPSISPAYAPPDTGHIGTVVVSLEAYRALRDARKLPPVPATEANLTDHIARVQASIVRIKALMHELRNGKSALT